MLTIQLAGYQKEILPSSWSPIVKYSVYNINSEVKEALGANSDLSGPPTGLFIPPVFMRHPQPSEVQRGLSGGVYGGCLCDRYGRGQILT